YDFSVHAAPATKAARASRLGAKVFRPNPTAFRDPLDIGQRLFGMAPDVNRVKVVVRVFAAAGQRDDVIESPLVVGRLDRCTAQPAEPTVGTADRLSLCWGA